MTVGSSPRLMTADSLQAVTADSLDATQTGSPLLPEAQDDLADKASNLSAPSILRSTATPRLIGAAAATPTAHLSAYEIERAERIARNHAMLVALGVAGLVGHSSLSNSSSTQPTAKRKRALTASDGTAAAAALQPTRGPSACQAARRGEPVTADGDGTEGGDGVAPGGQAPPQLADQLYTQQEYLALLGKELPQDHYVTDGRFTGWVPPDVVARFGLPCSEADYESRKASGAYRQQGKKGKVKDAKAYSATQLQSNPNAYFFRHVAPGEVQNLGPWSAEETEVFMDVCRQHGVGETFGLFASYMRTRVGYQCSAFYKQVLLPTGLVVDSRYKMTRQGRPVLCGGSASAEEAQD